MASQQVCLKAVALAVVAIVYACYGQTRHIGTAVTTLSLVAVVSLLNDLVTPTPVKKATPDDRLEVFLQDFWAFCTNVKNFVRRPLVQDFIFVVVGCVFVAALTVFGLVAGSAVVLMALLAPTLRPFCCRVTHGECGSKQTSEDVDSPGAPDFWFEQDELSLHECLRISEMIDSMTAAHEQEVCEATSSVDARLEFINGSEQRKGLMSADS